MRRLGLALLLGVLAALALPPLWFRLFREPAPELPPPGRRVALASGVAVNVVEEGAGPAVVLVHGHPGSAYDWRVLAPALAARGFRAIAYDRVGYGRSDARRDGEYTFAANARELLAAARGPRSARRDRGGLVVRRRHVDRRRAAGSLADRAPACWSGASGPVYRWAAAAASQRVAVLGARCSAWVARGSAGLGGGTSRDERRGIQRRQPQPDWWLPSLAANLARSRHPPTTARGGRGLRAPGGPRPDGPLAPRARDPRRGRPARARRGRPRAREARAERSPRPRARRQPHAPGHPRRPARRRDQTGTFVKTSKRK